jgi:hypothetical protein
MPRINLAELTWRGFGASTAWPLPSDAVLAAGVAVQPTFGVIEGLGALFDPAYLADPALKKVVPPALLAWYRTDEKPGKTADLLLLSADPLRSVQAWDRIESVIVRGNVIPREVLAAE